MSRRAHIVHFVSLIAIIVGLFAPVLEINPVIASDLADQDNEPQVTFETNDDADPEEPTDIDSENPVADPLPDSQPEPTPIVPQNPTYQEATCVDGLGFTQTLQPATEPGGVEYDYIDHGGGNIEIQARIDHAVLTWNTDAFLFEGSNWSLSEGVAIYRDTLTPCPVPDSDESKEPTDEVTEGNTEEPDQAASEEGGGIGITELSPVITIEHTAVAVGPGLHTVPMLSPAMPRDRIAMKITTEPQEGVGVVTFVANIPPGTEIKNFFDPVGNSANCSADIPGINATYITCTVYPASEAVIVYFVVEVIRATGFNTMCGQDFTHTTHTVSISGVNGVSYPHLILADSATVNVLCPNNTPTEFPQVSVSAVCEGEYSGYTIIEFVSFPGNRGIELHGIVKNGGTPWLTLDANNQVLVEPGAVVELILNLVPGFVWPDDKSAGDGLTWVQDTEPSYWARMFVTADEEPCVTTDPTFPLIDQFTVCVDGSPQSYLQVYPGDGITIVNNSISVNGTDMPLTAHESGDFWFIHVDNESGIVVTAELADGLEWPDNLGSSIPGIDWVIANQNSDIATLTFTTLAAVPCTPAEMPPLPTATSAVCEQGVFPGTSIVHVPAGDADGVQVVSVLHGTTVGAYTGTDPNFFGDYSFSNTVSGEVTITIALLGERIWPTDMAGWNLNNGTATSTVTLAPEPCVVVDIPEVVITLAECGEEGEQTHSVFYTRPTGAALSVAFDPASPPGTTFEPGTDPDSSTWHVPGHVTIDGHINYGLDTELDGFVLPSAEDMEAAGWEWNQRWEFPFELVGVDCESGLAISKSAEVDGETLDEGAGVAPGTALTWVITLTNTSNIETQAMVEDHIPLGFTVDDDGPAGCTLSTNGALVTCPSVTVPAADADGAGTWELRIPGTIENGEDAVCGEMTNTASYTEGQTSSLPDASIASTTTSSENSASSSVTVECAAIEIEKTRVEHFYGEPLPVSPPINSSGTISYGITVTNTGGIPLTNIKFQDTAPEGTNFNSHSSDPNICEATGTPSMQINCEIATLAPGTSISVYVGVYVLIDPSSELCQTNIVNTVYITEVTELGEFPISVENPYQSTDESAVNCVTISKSAEVDGETLDEGASVAPGTALTWVITITNMSDVRVPMTVEDDIPPGFTVDDDGPPGCTLSTNGDLVTCPYLDLPAADGASPGIIEIRIPGTIDNGENAVCGQMTNTVSYLELIIASVPGTSFAPTTTSPEISASSSVWVNCEDEWSVEKTNDVTTSALEVGDPIEYTITVTNDGPQDIDDGMELTDLFSGYGELTDWEIDGIAMNPQPEADDDGNYSVTLPEIQPEDDVEITATYIVTQEDIDAGFITNCATVGGEPAEEGDNCVTDDIDPNPEVHFEKREIQSSVAPGIGGLNPQVGFYVTLTNTGNITLNNAIITDDDLDSLPATGWNIEIWDVTAGTWVASSLDDPFGPLGPQRVLQLRITSDHIMWEQIELPDSEVCGLWENTATVTGEFADGTFIVTVIDEQTTEPGRSDDAEVLVNCTGLSIEKTSSVAEDVPLEPGQVFSYEIVIANNGTTDVFSVNVSDSVPPTLNVIDVTTDSASDACGATVGNDVDCDFDELLKGESITITIDVSVPAVGDITWEQCETTLENRAVIAGSFILTPPPVITSQNAITPPGEAIVSNPVINTIDCGDPVLEVEKTATSLNMDVVDPDTRMDDGDTITYEFTVTNESAYTLYNIDVTDHLPVGFEGDVDTIDSLAARTSDTLTATYIVTQADLDIGEVFNCADAAGTTTVGEGGEDVHAGQHCVTTYLEQEPALGIEKHGEVAITGDRVESGDVIEYTFIVSNTGNVTLNNIEIVDLLPGLTFPDGNIIVTVAPGQSAEVTATLVVSQTMIDIGIFENCAVAHGNGPMIDVAGSMSLNQAAGSFVTSDEDCDEQTFEHDPEVKLKKIGSFSKGADTTVTVGDVISYNFTLKNTGNVTLTNLIVTDPLPGLSWDGEHTIAALAPNDSVTLSASYEITQADIDAGKVLNCAIVTADPGDTSAEDCAKTRIPSVPPVVVELPSTGQGSIGAATSVMWAAATLGVLALGAAAFGTRYSRYR